MKKKFFIPEFADLPQSLPVFPLNNVLLLPGGHLPLNIFEPRYLAMVEHALGGNRLIGMVQPRQKNKGTDQENPIFKTGCAGKIIEFSETSEGHYRITLAGICRFEVTEELAETKVYRQVRPSWRFYEEDLRQLSCLGLDRARLKILLHKYFAHEGMDCDWEAIDDASDGGLITCLSMACPFDAQEKQALLEAPCSKTRAQLFINMLEMYACGTSKSHH